MQDEAVRAALASGAWREKKDPKSGRTYYVNAQTRTSVWNLAKELAKIPQQQQQEQTKEKSQNIAAELQEQAKRWQEEEAALMQHITDLEREKVRLESEISVLLGPTETEATALREEEKWLRDAKHSLEVVVAEELQKQREQTVELQQLQAHVEKLRLKRKQELEAFESLRKRLTLLQQEHAEALADLRREEDAHASLEEEHRNETRQLENALRAEARVKELIKMRAAEVDRMKAELKAVCERKAELQQHHQRLSEEVADGSMGAATDALQEGASPVSPLLLSRLQREVARRKKSLQQLKQHQRVGEEAEWMRCESAELRRVAASAEREAKQMALFLAELRAQVQVVAPLVEAVARDVQQLVAESGTYR
ncbi:hypothetical protein DQ04_03111020 [Trypanosoma grayi]|uniref:hypothetical protein n=1 Tax=Trypanosoma grayi TaxID=71804 RepID=UPI0004F483EE|nr:hypothetical protein DQ04_03111020 [Trypanosoma grayi]KEG10957.1 hypothetical protein DQ04_03111020 [Trypanosoma grayi]